MTVITVETMQALEYERIVKTHEQKAKRQIIKDKAEELIAQGIDKITAQTMAKVFYEYGL